jgi:hypothetical protein
MPQGDGQPAPARGDHVQGGPPTEESGGRRGRRRRRRRRRFGEQPQPGDVGYVAPPQTGQTDDAPSTTGELSLTSGDGQPIEGPNVRVHELAKELHVTSHDVIEKCEPDAGLHHVTAPMSSVTPEEATTIREMFSNDEDPSSDGSAVDSPMPGGAVGPRRKRRRRGRRGGGGQAVSGAAHGHQATATAPAEVDGHAMVSTQGLIDPTVQSGESQGGRRKRRRRGRRGRGENAGAMTGAVPSTSDMAMTTHQPQQNSNPPRSEQASTSPSSSGESQSSQAAPAKKKRRALYRAGRGSVSPLARQSSGDDSE